VYAATLSLGRQAVAVAGALGSTGAAKTASAAAAPATPAAAVAAQPSMPAHPRASVTPTATQPVTAATTSPQAAAGSQPWPQARGAQGSSLSSGRTGFSGHASWPVFQRSWYGGAWRGGQGFGFPARGGRGRP
jgi:hypothetical protein